MTFAPKCATALSGQASRRSGFTLIETMIVVALVAVLLALAAPSMKEMVETRRLRAINAQLVTDLQFARSEAIARRAVARVAFSLDAADMTCYTIYTAASSLNRCDCSRGPGSACTGITGATEIRTVQVLRSTSTLIKIPSGRRAFGFEPALGSLVSLPVDKDPEILPKIEVDTSIDTGRTLRTTLVQSGRPTVCGPTGSKLGLPNCES